MTIIEALNNLITEDDELTDSEKATLDNNGYLPIEAVLTPEEVTAINRRLGELIEEEGEDAGKEVHQEDGTYRLSNLIDKDPIFEKVVIHPKVLAGMRHVIGPNIKLSSLNSRAVHPGQGLQRLHADWGGAVKPGEYWVCNSIWLLDDFTTENGATRVVPGSHRSGKTVEDVMDDNMADHPDQIQILGKAGTVVVFNSHLWHGGMHNKTNSLRRAMHGYFCQRDQKQQLNQRKFLRQETLTRLSPEARIILDVDNH